MGGVKEGRLGDSLAHPFAPIILCSSSGPLMYVGCKRRTAWTRHPGCKKVVPSCPDLVCRAQGEHGRAGTGGRLSQISECTG